MGSFIHSTMYSAFIPLTILAASTSAAASTSLEAYLYDGSQYVKVGDNTSIQLKLTASMSDATLYTVALESKNNGNTDTSCIEAGDVVTIASPDGGRVGLAAEMPGVYMSHPIVESELFYIQSDTVGCIELMDQVRFESHEEFWPRNLYWFSDGDVVSTNTTGTTYQLVSESASQASYTQWRIRNATAQLNSKDWQFREIAFCADAECTQKLSGGTAIDSGASRSWSLPEFAFDGDTSTFWKTIDNAGVAGEAWLGMDYGSHTEVCGIYLKTDNIVYSVDSIYVEYYDADSAQWVTASTLADVPHGSELTYALPCSN